jgi:hypothetical protein
MKYIALLLLTGSLFAQTEDSKYITGTLYPAVSLLYSQDDQGSMKMRCTATAIGFKDGVTTFVTAAHCACQDNSEKKTVSPPKDVVLYVTSDDPEDKEFEKATITGCGYRHRGDDFLLLSVKSKKTFPIVALGNDPKLLEPVVNVASPLGLGKQAFIGSVSSPSLERPVVDGDINWDHVVMLQIFGVDGGSSGSAVICLDQHAICAFVVGSIDDTSVTAMPVSRLKKLQAGLADKSYKYWVADPDAMQTPTAAEKK